MTDIKIIIETKRKGIREHWRISVLRNGEEVDACIGDSIQECLVELVKRGYR